MEKIVPVNKATLRKFATPVALAFVLTGCSTDTSPPAALSSRSPTHAAEVPASAVPAAGAADVCEEISAQMEALNFFPLTLSTDTEDPGSAALGNIQELETNAPPELKEDVAALREIIAAAVADPSAFQREDFIQAKIEVENWGLQNC